eukprot:GILJ01008279.1.p1 GENE.GILJ01008279.1~~GILJ01008279.1.p1  ORF type:complete len:1151 (-),score=189.97 GILJ01008279.1:169-3576(-)
MMMKRVVLVIAALSVAAVSALSENRFLTHTVTDGESFRHRQTSRTANVRWNDFWEYIQTKFPDFNVEGRRIRGVGAFGAAYTLPSRSSSALKVLKVRLTNGLPLKIGNADAIASHGAAVTKALQWYRTKYTGSQQAAWADAFVSRTVYYDDAHYLFEVMDHVQGMTLAEYVQSGSVASLSAVHIDRLLQQLARILFVLAHARIIHADLHPGNIMLTRDGRLVVIDLDRGRVCDDVKNIEEFKFEFGKKQYVPFDVRLNVDFSISKDTCVSTDAYAMGVTVLGLVAIVNEKDAVDGTSLLSFRATALDRLSQVELPGDDASDSAVNPLRIKLQRLLTALLEDHGAARTAATYAMLAEKWLSDAAHQPLTFAATDTAPAIEDDPEKIAIAAAEQRGGYEQSPVDEEPVTVKDESSSPSSSFDVAKNGIIKYLKEVNVETFPPGDSIPSRQQRLRSYVPNDLFHQGLHLHAKRDLNQPLLYNVFLLQRYYRFKLILQRTTEQSACGTYGLLESDPFDPMLVAVDTASNIAGDVTSTFSFKGQPLAVWLQDLKLDNTKLIHVSLLNWNNAVVVGGCLNVQRNSKSDSGTKSEKQEESQLRVIVWEIQDESKAARGVYSFVYTEGEGDGEGEGEGGLVMTPPKVVVVGGGPAGLYAAMQAKASAAAVTVWERRERYSRLYCQACAVTDYVTAYNMETEAYLKSVENVLASVLMTVGVNVQFRREFLWIDNEQNIAFARVVSPSSEEWHGKEKWPDLENKWLASPELQKETFDLLIGAEGSNSPIRAQYLKSSFVDRQKVVFDEETKYYKKRILSRKSGEPIKSVAILQFFKERCYGRGGHLSATCVHTETAFNAIWPAHQQGVPFCFFEYIENELGLTRLRDILKKHELQEDADNYWNPLKQHPDAVDDLYHMLLARYISSKEHTKSDVLKELAVSTEAGKGCTYTEKSTDDKPVNHFKKLEDQSLFSMFWLRTRSAHTFAANTPKGGVVAIVGDATRDSFFPFGNGLNSHLDAMSIASGAASSKSSSPTKASPIGALVRKEIDATNFNQHMKPRIDEYVDESSWALISSVSCIGPTGKTYTANNGAASRTLNYAHFAKREALSDVQERCPFLDVTDESVQPRADSEESPTRTTVLESNH